MKRWSDLPVEKRDVWVEKVKIGDILGKEICITGYEIRSSRYGGGDEPAEYVQINFELSGERHFTNTSSMLLRKQLESIKDNLPILATIVQKGQWFSLS